MHAMPARGEAITHNFESARPHVRCPCGELCEAATVRQVRERQRDGKSTPECPDAIGVTGY
jgi:hypothetical protein